MQVSPKELAELKANFMELYDDNKDGKIEIREVGLQVSAATYMPPGVCCYNYIDRYLLPTMFCQVYAARTLVADVCRKVYAARSVLPGNLLAGVCCQESIRCLLSCQISTILSCVSCQESLTRCLLP